MKRPWLRSVRTCILRSLLLVSALSLVRCAPSADGGLAGREPPAEPVSVALSPSNPRIAQGTGLGFALRATYPDGRSADVAAAARWSVLDAQGREVQAANEPGLITLAQPGRYRVLARWAGRALETPIEVSAATLTALAISPRLPSLAVGLKQQFALKADFSDGTSQDVTALATWALKSISGTGVAVIDSSGLLTASAEGKVTVSGRYKTRVSSTTVTVTAARIASIALSPANPALAKGTRLKFTATATLTDASTQDVSGVATWSVQDVVGTGVAEIDTSGSALGRAVGKATVSAEHSGISASTTLEVTPARPIALTVTPPFPSIAKGTTQAFSAFAALSDGSSQDVTALVDWTAIDRTGTGVASIDARGVATGNAVGTSQIKASYGGLDASSTLTVTPAVLTRLQLAPARATVSRGTTQVFAATGSYSDGSTQDVSATATWAITDVMGTGVASIDARGVATAKAEGTAAVSALYQGQSASATLEVVAPAIVSLSISPVDATVGRGMMQQFTARAALADGSTQDVSATATWSTADLAGTSVASVDGTGLATAKAEGKAGITATFRGKSATATLTVQRGLAVLTVPTAKTLWGVYAAAANDVWAAGLDGTVLRWDGASWRTVPSPAGSENLGRIWGRSPSDIWIAGLGGSMLHWDGTSLTRTAVAGSGVSIWDVWGSGPRDVWATASNGIYRFDGTSWALRQSTSDLATAVWGSSASDVWFATAGTSGFRWNGTALSTVSLPVAKLWALAGSSASDVWAVSDQGDVVRYNGTSWSRLTSPVKTFLVGISVQSASDVVISGWEGTILRWDGTALTKQASPVTKDLLGITRGFGATWITGSEGTLLRGD